MAYAIMRTLVWTHTWTTAGRGAQLIGRSLGAPH